MRRHALCDKTKVALNDRGGSFLDRPFANIGEGFATNGSLLRGLRGGPPVFPIFGELFEEGSLDFCGLYSKVRRLETKNTNMHTLKTGLSFAEAVETRAAARKAGSATLRMIVNTKDQDEERK
jgi:hypothetical protein